MDSVWLIIAIASACVATGYVSILAFGGFISLRSVMSVCVSENASPEVKHNFSFSEIQLKGQELLNQASLLFWISMAACVAGAMKSGVDWYIVIIVVAPVVIVGILMEKLSKHRVGKKYVKYYDYVCAWTTAYENGEATKTEAHEKIDKCLPDLLIKAAKINGACGAFFIATLIGLAWAFV